MTSSFNRLHLVVNARHVKQVPGRKTNIGDAQWLAMLARAGLLHGSFVPPARMQSLCSPTLACSLPSNRIAVVGRASNQSPKL